MILVYLPLLKWKETREKKIRQIALDYKKNSISQSDKIQKIRVRVGISHEFRVQSGNGEIKMICWPLVILHSSSCPKVYEIIKFQYARLIANAIDVYSSQ